MFIENKQIIFIFFGMQLYIINEGDGDDKQEQLQIFRMKRN